MRHRLAVLSVVLVAALAFALPQGIARADAPTITTITPSSGPTAGGTVLTILGAGFQPGAGVTYVSVGGVLATNVVVVNTTTIQATTPPNGALGTVQVVVINPDGGSTYVAGFTYTAGGATNNGSLAVSSINPPAGTPGQAIYVTGAGFDATSTITFGGIAAPAFNVINSGYGITYAPTGGSGTVNVVVTNANGTQATAAQQFTYTGTGSSANGSLSITSVTPTSLAAGGTVVVNGTGFVAGATVTIGGYAATNVNVPSATMLTATIPAGPTAGVTLVVTNPSSKH